MTTKTTKTTKTTRKPRASTEKTPVKARAVTPQATTKKDTTNNNKIKMLEEKLNQTEARLNTLINVLHTEMKNHLERGPEGLASKMKNNNLLD